MLNLRSCGNLVDMQEPPFAAAQFCRPIASFMCGLLLRVDGPITHEVRVYQGSVEEAAKRRQDFCFRMIG